MSPAGYLSVITRLAGSAMIVSSLSGLGFYWAGLLDREMQELDRLETALAGLSADISYALLPLREALRRQGKKVEVLQAIYFQAFRLWLGWRQGVPVRGFRANII